MKKFLSLVALSGLMICGVSTFSHSEGTNNIQVLDVDTKNTVNGDITADGADSRVKIGDTDISKTEAQSVKVKAVNETGNVTAKSGGKVDVGNTKLENVKAGEIDIDSFNRTKDIEATNNGTVGIGNTTIQNVEKGDFNINKNFSSSTVIGGKVTADGKGSSVKVADVLVDGVNADTVTINSRNRLDKEVKATGGATVNVGSTSLKNLKGGTVNVKSDNHVIGNITASDKSQVSVGNTATH